MSWMGLAGLGVAAVGRRKSGRSSGRSMSLMGLKSEKDI